jgi:hypothetical protein
MRRSLRHTSEWLLALVCSFFALTCNEKSYPPSPDYPLNMIVTSAFAVDGEPSFEGWTLTDSAFIQFSSDVPHGQSGVSVVIPSQHAAPSPTCSLQQIIPARLGKHVFRLSFWGKRVLTAGYYNATVVGTDYCNMQESSCLSWLSSFGKNTNWTFYSILSDTVSLYALKSADFAYRVYLTGGYCDSGGSKYYVYNPKLEMLN